IRGVLTSARVARPLRHLRPGRGGGDMAFPSIFRGYPVGSLQDSRDPFWAMDRLFEEMWRTVGAPALGARSGFSPRVDVIERDEEYLVTAELPGVEEKDLQLEVHGNVLTLSGEKRA